MASSGTIGTCTTLKTRLRNPRVMNAVVRFGSGGRRDLVRPSVRQRPVLASLRPPRRTYQRCVRACGTRRVGQRQPRSYTGHRFEPVHNWEWRQFAEKPEPCPTDASTPIPESDFVSEESSALTRSSVSTLPTPDGTRQFVALVSSLLVLGIVLSVVTVVLVTNMGIKFSVIKVLRKFIRSDIARQVFTIIGSMLFVRSGLTPLIRAIREFLGIRTPWESSIECYLLRELYSPLELLLVVAALAALSESLLPPLISVPRSVIDVVVRSILSLTFISAAARVVHNMKGRLFREAKWRMELEGKTTDQHRIDAIDKLLTVGIVIVSFIMGLQALGLDVNSVLAIGGVGGLAVGLAGREILENLFSGLLIMGSRAFEVGDEVVLLTAAQDRVEGIVVDVGWYRTLVRDFEREVYVIPNSLFSRTVVLNVTRKGREWRFFEHFHIRLRDLDKADAIISDMRRLIRQDSRVIQKLHKRAFLNEINREFVSLYISFYVEASNRDAFMAIREQFFLDFVDCVLRNGGEIAEKKLIVEYSAETGMMEPPSFLPGEALQTMNMVDMDGDTETLMTSKNSSEQDNGHSSYSGGVSSQVEVSSVIKKISPVEDSRRLRKRDTSSS